jgi:hypothetical protein
MYRETLCDKVCQWLAAGRWFFLGPLVSSTNKTERHNIAEILLKVVLSTIKPTNHYCDLWTAPGTVILTETLILSEPQSTLVHGHSQVNAWWISLVQINVWHMSIPMEKSNLELIWNNTYYMQLLPMSTVKYNTVKSCYLKVHRTFQKFGSYMSIMSEISSIILYVLYTYFNK